MNDVALYNQPHTAVLYVDNAMIPVVVGGQTGPAGATGPAGPQGIQGVKGDPGKQVLNGIGPPPGALGLDGDFYIDTAADAIYGPKTGGAWGPATSLIGPTGPQGIQGIQGPTGATGATGPRGYSVLNGAGAPTAGTGIDGDFFINTSANTIYGPKTAGSWGAPTSMIGPQGPTGATGAASTVPGPTGPAGPRGYSVLNGAGPPAMGAGVDGDFYINTAANTIYGPKTSGNWGSPTSLVGPAGPTGPQGIQGEQGLPGAGSTSDLVYGTGWNGVGNVSPSQNAVYDKIELLVTDIATKAPSSALAGYVPVTKVGTNQVTATGASSKIILNQTGGTYGGTGLTILSEGTVHGAQFSSSLGVVDFSFSVLGGSGNLRYERRAGSTLTANAWEFQFGTDTAPEARVGPSAVNFVAPMQIGFPSVTQLTAGVALNVNGTGKFAGAVTIPADAYGAGWAAKLEAPTKKDVYDKVQTLATGAFLPLAGGSMTGNIGMAAATGIAIDTPTSAAKIRLGSLPAIPAWGGVFLNASFTGSAWALDDVAKNGWFFKLDARSNVGDNLNGMWLYRVPQGANPHTDETADFGITNGFAYFRNGVSIGNATAAAPAGGAKLDVTGNIAASGTITSGGSTLATVSQLANYLPLTGGVVQSLVVKPAGSANANMYISPSGGGVYSVLELQGEGSVTTQGLSIMAGQLQSWFSCDAYTFRKADGVTPLMTLNTSSMNLSTMDNYMGRFYGAAADFYLSFRNTNYYTNLYFYSYDTAGANSILDAVITSYRGFGMMLSGNPGLALRAGAAQTTIATITTTGLDITAGKTLTIGGVAVGGATTAAGINFASTNRLLGRNSAGAGPGEEVTPAQALSLIGAAPDSPTIINQSTSLTVTAATHNNTHIVFSGASRVLTLGSIAAGVSFSGRFTTAWTITCSSLSKNGAAPVANGAVAANSLVTFVHEGSGTWVASGAGLT